MLPGREGRRVCDRNPKREIGKIAKQERKRMLKSEKREKMMVVFTSNHKATWHQLPIYLY